MCTGVILCCKNRSCVKEANSSIPGAENSKHFDKHNGCLGLPLELLIQQNSRAHSRDSKSHWIVLVQFVPMDSIEFLHDFHALCLNKILFQISETLHNFILQCKLVLNIYERITHIIFEMCLESQTILFFECYIIWMWANIVTRSFGEFHNN